MAKMVAHTHPHPRLNSSCRRRVVLLMCSAAVLLWSSCMITPTMGHEGKFNALARPEPHSNVTITTSDGGKTYVGTLDHGIVVAARPANQKTLHLSFRTKGGEAISSDTFELKWFPEKIPRNCEHAFGCLAVEIYEGPDADIRNRVGHDHHEFPMPVRASATATGGDYGRWGLVVHNPDPYNQLSAPKDGFMATFTCKGEAKFITDATTSNLQCPEKKKNTNTELHTSDKQENDQKLRGIS